MIPKLTPLVQVFPWVSANIYTWFPRWICEQWPMRQSVLSPFFLLPKPELSEFPCLFFLTWVINNTLPPGLSASALAPLSSLHPAAGDCPGDFASHLETSLPWSLRPTMYCPLLPCYVGPHLLPPAPWLTPRQTHWPSHGFSWLLEYIRPAPASGPLHQPCPLPRLSPSLPEGS